MILFQLGSGVPYFSIFSGPVPYSTGAIGKHIVYTLVTSKPNQLIQQSLGQNQRLCIQSLSRLSDRRPLSQEGALTTDQAYFLAQTSWSFKDSGVKTHNRPKTSDAPSIGA